MADIHALNEFCRYSCGCAVPLTCKDYWEENHGWSYLFKPLDATLRQLRSDRAPVMNNDARGEDLEAGGGDLYL
ncbi:hypothetical protein YC2023_076960 [Brassica napus]